MKPQEKDKYLLTRGLTWKAGEVHKWKLVRMASAVEDGAVPEAGAGTGE